MAACMTCNNTRTVDNVSWPIGAKNPAYHDNVPCWACCTAAYDRWVIRQRRGH